MVDLRGPLTRELIDPVRAILEAFAAAQRPADRFTLIAAAAAVTEQLRLGHLVLGNTYRYPGLVAKMASTINAVSHGRFVLGIGASWFQREHEAYGWDFPPMRERQDRLEESCQLLRTLFRSDAPVDFDGQYYHLNEAPLAPGACRVRVDLDLCQGHGVCVDEAPAVFRVDEKERRVVLLDETPGADQRERVKLAVRHCPTRALSIEE